FIRPGAMLNGVAAGIHNLPEGKVNFNNPNTALGGSAPIVNDGAFSAGGNAYTIGGSGGFANNGQANDGSLTISNTGANINNGSLAATNYLSLTGAPLTNTGTINLNGGQVLGAVALRNASGGLIYGPGTIQTPFFNDAGATVASTI